MKLGTNMEVRNKTAYIIKLHMSVDRIPISRRLGEQKLQMSECLKCSEKYLVLRRIK